MFSPEQEEPLAQRVANNVMSTMKVIFPGLSPMIVTGTSTPGVSVENYDNDDHDIVPPLFELELTNYVGYALNPRQETRKYVYEVSKGIRNVDGQKSRYTVEKTRSHIRIKDGSTVIFRCGNQNVCARNLLLELHGARFDIPTWLEDRNNNCYDNWNYSSLVSPLSNLY